MTQINTSADNNSIANTKIRFTPNTEFEKELKKRVSVYFEENSVSKKDNARMYLKTFIAVLWVAASYSLLVFAGLPVWGLILAAVSLGVALNALSFNVMHDALHGAYSERPWVNKLMGHFLDLIGGSSYFWYRKHNYFHHSYPNIAGHDDDIEAGIFARLSPHHKRYFFHRFQHIYIWPLYGFLAVKWHLFDDFYTFFTKKINGHEIDRPGGWDAVVFFGGKLFFLTMAFVIPLFFYPVLYVIVFYMLVAFLQGLIMSVVFQLAHCNEDAGFPMHSGETKQMDTSWMVHQLSTTTDFGKDNHFLTWYLGGLNYQVEHHLFPKICHVNYPALSRIVEDTCREYSVTYNAYKGFFSGLRSHYNWLRFLGQAG
jgi:linoleoyl-CoA desaturase